MNVKRIELHHAFVHEDHVLELPDAGIVLVTGRNGSGKSSFVEGVATALWGKTLRGTPAWRKDGSPGSINVRTDKVTAVRSRKGPKTALLWHQAGAEPTEYENTQKAQEALERLVGTLPVWRRTRVFSLDSDNFTSCTDGERKRLLEEILGLTRFDTAAEACSALRKVANDKVFMSSTHIGIHDSNVADCLARVAKAHDELERLVQVQDLEAFKERHRVLTKMARDSADEVTALEKVLRKYDEKSGEHSAALRVLEMQYQRVKDSKCNACGQPIPDEARAELLAKMQVEKAAAEEYQSAVAGERKVVELQIADLKSEQRSLMTKVTENAASHSKAEETNRARGRADAQLAEAKKAADVAAAKLDAARKDVTEAKREAGELNACDMVLGLKGVRAHVLGEALAGVEAVANAWLSRIATAGMQLKLLPYTEKKAGGVSDSISMEVSGAGDGYGYKASSGGERKRIDVALLLALAEIAQAAHGVGPGTLFFDEVFDSLDKDGTDAVCEAVAELAETRAVVVISHSDLLADRLPGARRVCL